MFTDVINSALIAQSKLHEISSEQKVPNGTDSASIFGILMKHIEDFQQNLDEEHEVGVMLASFGKEVSLTVDEVDFEYPSIISFKGHKNGDKTQLIQHVSQLNFLLIAVQKEPNRPKRKIGFSIPEE